MKIFYGEKFKKGQKRSLFGHRDFRKSHFLGPLFGRVIFYGNSQKGPNMGLFVDFSFFGPFWALLAGDPLGSLFWVFFVVFDVFYKFIISMILLKL